MIKFSGIRNQQSGISPKCYSCEGRNLGLDSCLRENDKKGADSSGFSLIELIVVISILSILSVTSFIGFRYLSDHLRAREVVGVIEDILREIELKVLKGDYELVQFTLADTEGLMGKKLAAYAVVTVKPPSATLNLSLGGLCNETNKTGRWVITTAQSSTPFYRKDEQGKALEISSLGGNIRQKCVFFREAKESEWQFELASGQEVSPLIRFIHFNLDHESNAPLFLVDLKNAEYRLDVEGPYGKKLFFKDNALGLSPVTLALEREGKTLPQTLELP